MAVNKEYSCATHGDFESRAEKPKCPRGCNTVKRVFLTPPGMKSTRTSNTDRMIQADLFSKGMSDYSNRNNMTPAERRLASVDPALRPRYVSAGKDVHKTLASTKVTAESRQTLAGADGSRGLVDVRPALQKPRTVLVAPNYTG